MTIVKLQWIRRLLLMIVAEIDRQLADLGAPPNATSDRGIVTLAK
jgi:hypothetical protein